MRCPDHPEEIVGKARADIYWCDKCGAWLIKKLGHTTRAIASKTADDETMRKRFRLKSPGIDNR